MPWLLLGSLRQCPLPFWDRFGLVARLRARDTSAMAPFILARPQLGWNPGWGGKGCIYTGVSGLAHQSNVHLQGGRQEILHNLGLRMRSESLVPHIITLNLESHLQEPVHHPLQTRTRPPPPLQPTFGCDELQVDGATCATACCMPFRESGFPAGSADFRLHAFH